MRLTLLLLWSIMSGTRSTTTIEVSRPNAYLADKSVESHQQVLLAVVGTLRIIYAMNDDESEIARYSVFAKRRIGAS